MENDAEVAVAEFGRGMAAIIMGTFGFVWLSWGFSVTAPVWNFSTAFWAAFFVVSAALLGFAIATVRRGRLLMKAQGASRREFWSKRRKPFRIVSFSEGLGCIIVIILANRFHRPDLIAWGISFVIGLHFIPLGRVFGFRGYYFVGSLIVGWDIVCIAALRSSRPSAFAALGTGVILWAVVLSLLVRPTRQARNLVRA